MPDTTTSSANLHLATEKLSEPVIAAHMPRLGALMSVVHLDTSMDGARSRTRKMSRNSDLGAASGGTEASDPSPTIELARAAAVSGTIDFGVHETAVISEEVVKTELGLSDSQVRPYFTAGSSFSLEQAETLLAPYVQRLYPMGLQKMVADGYALFSSVANSVGSSSAATSIENLIEAVFAQRRQQPLRPTRERRFLLGNTQIENITKEALVTNGGLGGSLWTMQADFSSLNMPPDQFEGDGFVGSFLGYPVHEIDEEMVPTSGGADIGLFGNFGVPGVPADDPRLGGRPGAFELSVETPLQIRVDIDTSKACIELTLLARYLWLEVVDANVIRVLGQS